MNHHSYYKPELHQQKIRTLSDMRESFCGMGTNRAKRRLAKLAVNDAAARSLLIALRTEDANISAKKYSNTIRRSYSDNYYRTKERLLGDLTELCRTAGFTYGYQSNSARFPKYIIYFDLPGCEQISWHSDWIPKDCPEYHGEWDKKENSTLTKLEKAIKSLLSRKQDEVKLKWKE